MAGFTYQHIRTVTPAVPGGGTVTEVIVTSPNATIGVTNGDITTSGTIELDVAYGSTANTAVQGNDVRVAGGDPQFFVPTAGGTVSPTATGAEIHCFISPAGTLATLTLTLPTGNIKGQVLWATFNQIITALTVTNTNTDTKGFASPSAATATTTYGWVWDSISTKWNRFE